MNEKGYTTTTFVIDGCVVKVNRPILTAEERAKAERNIITALSNFKEKKR